VAKSSRRSIDALFAPSQPAGVADLDSARSIAVDLLDANPFQPRKTFDDAALVELADDIEEHGVLQPLLVRPHPQERGRYQIAAGERRWRAARLASLAQVPCIERDMDDGAMERLALTENIQRADLDPVDEAQAYRRLMDRYGLSLRDLATEVHKHHEYIAQRLRLLEVPRIAQAVREEKIGPTVGQELARVKNAGQREELLGRAERGERVTVQDVRAVQEIVRKSGRADGSKVSNNSTPRPSTSVEQPTDQPLSNNSTAMDTIIAPPADGRLQPLYGAFQDWRARVYGEMNQLTNDERETLSRLLRGDIAQILDRLGEQ
jgi:ParB family chromosome partitioning protein